MANPVSRTTLLDRLRAERKSTFYGMQDALCLEAAADDERAGIAWWNALTEAERAEWLRRAGSARVVDAWEAWKIRFVHVSAA